MQETGAGKSGRDRTQRGTGGGGGGGGGDGGAITGRRREHTNCARNWGGEKWA